VPSSATWDGFMIGELAVRASRLAISRERAHQRERMVGAAGGPGAAAIGERLSQSATFFPTYPKQVK